MKSLHDWLMSTTAFAPADDGAGGGTIVADGDADDGKATETKTPLATGAEDDGKGTKTEPTKGTKTEPAKTDGEDDGKGGKKTVATGADTDDEKDDKETKETWPKDWRERIARHASAGDEKAFKKEMKRLERITDPAGIYGSFRDLEAKFSEGGLVKIPGKGAKPEEIVAFAKQLGWGDKPDEMLSQIKLDDGLEMGSEDKPVVASFVAAVHGATSAQEFTNRAANWYFKQQEAAAAALDEADDEFRRESETALKEELGPAFKRNINAIGSIFAQAPGGADIKNEKSLYARLMGGRTADGRVIGNDPDMVRFLLSMVSEINPAATVVEDGNQSGESIEAEIKKIEGIMRTDRRDYDKNYAARYTELLAVREKQKKRA